MQQKIGIINYGAGNTQSVAYALQRCNANYILSNSEEELNTCDKLIFPGVGHAAHAMQKLKEYNLIDYIKQTEKKLLGICLGMQLMCSHTEEGETTCLNIFDIPVLKFVDIDLKIPCVGWNNIELKNNNLFNNIKGEIEQYFVHSYYVPNNKYCIATTEYGLTFAAALQKDNFYAVQFHPEKSGLIGQFILNNFLQL